LLAQFLSETTNNRTDDYGGTLENVSSHAAAQAAHMIENTELYAQQRSRIIRDIVSGIRTKVTDPNFIVGIKLNSVEFQVNGFQVDYPMLSYAKECHLT
jgi:2,4-dienoyl-CoA reductase-like NADH-dependent reductase (Old Yellow Enzyme family)